MSTASCWRVSRDLSRNARASALVVSIDAAVEGVSMRSAPHTLELFDAGGSRELRSALGAFLQDSFRDRAADHADPVGHRLRELAVSLRLEPMVLARVQELREGLERRLSGKLRYRGEEPAFLEESDPVEARVLDRVLQDSKTQLGAALLHQRIERGDPDLGIGIQQPLEAQRNDFLLRVAARRQEAVAARFRIGRGEELAQERKRVFGGLTAQRMNHFADELAVPQALRRVHRRSTERKALAKRGEPSLLEEEEGRGDRAPIGRGREPPH